MIFPADPRLQRPADGREADEYPGGDDPFNRRETMDSALQFETSRSARRGELVNIRGTTGPRVRRRLSG
ncbi:hypothetical protein FBR04_09230 [Betaproteobacteria bacterium PRO7]|nr:hypothetical protein [Betaproteobacteria bacterium PRO7]